MSTLLKPLARFVRKAFMLMDKVNAIRLKILQIVFIILKKWIRVIVLSVRKNISCLDSTIVLWERKLRFKIVANWILNLKLALLVWIPLFWLMIVLNVYLKFLIVQVMKKVIVFLPKWLVEDVSKDFIYLIRFVIKEPRTIVWSMKEQKINVLDVQISFI